MKRRASWHDYRQPGTYMLTLVVEGRMPLLGRLRLDDIIAENGMPDASKAYIELSALGKAIRGEVCRKMVDCYPQMEVWRVCIMPDHLHVIVRVREALPDGKHLGHVVAGFKRGCYKAARELGLGEIIAENGRRAERRRQEEERRKEGEERRREGEERGKTAGNRHTVPCDSFAGRAGMSRQTGLGQRQARAASFSLFEQGYNDRLLFDGEQLERWKHYLADNPRRLALKRLHPDLFTVKRGMRIAGHDCQIVGNPFLLDIPDKVAVIVHRRYSEDEYQRLTELWLACGERGGVLVSAAIAPREKAVLTEARQRGYKIIWLRENGFSEFYKPSGTTFDACSEGQILQVSPWQYHTEQHIISRDECLQLNTIAIMIAGGETSIAD